MTQKHPVECLTCGRISCHCDQFWPEIDDCDVSRRWAMKRVGDALLALRAEKVLTQHDFNTVYARIRAEMLREDVPAVPAVPERSQG